MTTETVRFGRLRGDDVVHETLDGETVMIDLETGAYYTARGPAATVFNRILSGQEVSSVIDALADEYPAQADVRAQGDAFVELLLVANVISVNGSPSTPDSLATAHLDFPDEFQPLLLEGFNDLNDLLLLDPIHEVDPEAGWPHTTV